MAKRTREDSGSALEARYVIGIDLGTTNSALAYVDTHQNVEVGGTPAVQVFAIPQLVHPGEVAERPLLPSFLYLAAGSEVPAGALDLPWASGRDFAVGAAARRLGEKVPGRLVASAKSWLSHPRIDRKAAILPWGSEDAAVTKLSPLAASTRYLEHLRDAWNAAKAAESPADRLENQDVYLTVPASFDAVARELTAQAARDAGFRSVTLLEEPQAAFYAWIQHSGDGWRDKVGVGDVVLVCDIGGGTTDFTLIAVEEEAGNLTLERIAVGDHILLGGDNMDLALAHRVKAKLQQAGHKLGLSQTLALWHLCRQAKERLLSDDAIDKDTITLTGAGSRLIGGTISTELTRAVVMEVLLDGFFPAVPFGERPTMTTRTALQELGLDYAADAAIPRHVAAFLLDQAREGDEAGYLRPTAILFNGGVTKSPPVRERLVATLDRWAVEARVDADPLRVLESVDLDLAVCRGAAYYGMVRRGKGIRIRGGTARSYYIGVESSMPAVPGMRPPMKALCLVPFGTEEGSEPPALAREFGLVVGQPAEFRFLSSTIRRDDPVGTVIEDWEAEPIEELAPLETLLSSPDRKPGSTVPVQLRCRVTEVGTLEIKCVAAESAEEWKLEFNVRDAGA